MCGWTCPRNYPFNEHFGCPHLACSVGQVEPEEVITAAMDLV
jgi:hypothetical protein